MELDAEPPEPAEGEALMTNEQFDEEFSFAARGEWEALDLDELPDDWQEATMEDLRNA